MKNKIITICGSLRFQEEIINNAIKLELEGYTVLIPIIPLNNKMSLTNKEKEILGNIHKERIKISDAIYVINVNDYIGSATKSEIAYAKEHNKEIIYYQK